MLTENCTLFTLDVAWNSIRYIHVQHVMTAYSCIESIVTENCTLLTLDVAWNSIRYSVLGVST
jgi:hypothetical protein